MHVKIATEGETPPLLIIVPGAKSDAPLQFTSQTVTETKVKNSRTYSVAMENDLLVCKGTSSSVFTPVRYVVGVYDEATKTVVFHEAPLIKLDTHVKRFKNAAAPSEIIGVKNIEARNALGQTFGTRKKKLAIKAVQDNRIELDSVEQVAYAIEENIHQNIASIPTREEMKRKSQSDRPIPPYNMDATHPDQVYDILDICAPEELVLLPYKEVIAIQFKEDLKEWLGHISPSVYVFDKMNDVMQSKGNTKKINYLLYLSYLLAFASLKERALNRYFIKFAKNEEDSTHPLHDILGYAPEPVIESVLLKFTEKKIEKGVVEYKLPDLMKDKLLAYIFTIALIVEDYTFVPVALIKDLSLTQAKADLILKELGCVAVQIKKADSPTGAASKSYSLRVPLKFPNKTR